MNLSTITPTTVQIRRGHLMGLIFATAALAATITWLLVALAFDAGATRAQQSTPRPGAATPAAGASTGYPPNYRGLP